MWTTSTNCVAHDLDGAGVVARVGLHALGAFADHVRLGHILLSRFVARGEPVPSHDRG